MSLTKIIWLVGWLRSIQAVNYEGLCPDLPSDLVRLDNLRYSIWSPDYLLPDIPQSIHHPFFRPLTPSQLKASRIQFDYPVMYFYQVWPVNCLSIAGNLTVDLNHKYLNFSYLVGQGVPVKSSYGCIENFTFYEQNLFVKQIRRNLIIWKCADSRPITPISHNLVVMILSEVNSTSPLSESEVLNFTYRVPLDWIRVGKDEVNPKLVCSRIDCPIPESKSICISLHYFCYLVLFYQFCF